MAKKVKSYRLESGLIERIAAYAKSRGSSETQVIEAAAESFLDLARSGVPDLPQSSSKRRPVEEPRNLRAIYASERQAKLNAAKGSR